MTEPGTAPSDRREPPQVLRDANYRRLLIGRTVSLIGDGIAPVALAFAILDLTGSAADIGIVLGVRSMLLVALLLAGGVVADRLSPRSSMIQSDLIRFVAMGLIAALLVSGRAEIWQLAILYGVHGVATALFNPASAALPPLILNNWQLQPGNAMLGLAKAGG
jgi:MFS family permease